MATKQAAKPHWSRRSHKQCLAKLYASAPLTHRTALERKGLTSGATSYRDCGKAYIVELGKELRRNPAFRAACIPICNDNLQQWWAGKRDPEDWLLPWLRSISDRAEAVAKISLARLVMAETDLQAHQSSLREIIIFDRLLPYLSLWGKRFEKGMPASPMQAGKWSREARYHLKALEGIVVEIRKLDAVNTGHEQHMNAFEYYLSGAIEAARDLKLVYPSATPKRIQAYQRRVETNHGMLRPKQIFADILWVAFMIMRKRGMPLKHIRMLLNIILPALFPPSLLFPDVATPFPSSPDAIQVRLSRLSRSR